MTDTDTANARVRHLLANAVERVVRETLQDGPTRDLTVIGRNALGETVTETIKLRPRILCNAIADHLRGGSVPLWSITVTGLHPHDHRRVYEIEAKSDTLAAQEGIRRFVEEMECLTESNA